MTIKTLTMDELKKDYSTRKGFVFQAARPSKESSFDNLAKTLIDKGITNSQPEFVTTIPDNIHVFVYGDDFDSATFYQLAFDISQFTGLFKIETLYNFLR